LTEFTCDVGADANGPSPEIEALARADLTGVFFASAYWVSIQFVNSRDKKQR